MISPDPVPTIPSTPDPEVATLIASLLRHILTILATLGVVHGAYSDSALMIVASSIVGIGTVGWALWQKRAAAKRANRGAVQSAIFGRAVKAG